MPGPSRDESADAAPSNERDLFGAALELPAEARDAFVDAQTDDPNVRARVKALLRAHAQIPPTFLEPGELFATAPTVLIGRRIGAYRLVRELGRGGMGVVFLAVRADDELEKSVAIKIVGGGWFDDGLVQRFRRERQILSALEHPHIARLLDAGTTSDGLSFFVMEHVEGVRIDRYVRDGRLPVRAVLTLFQEVCAAVQFAHSRLIVHRDLKPANILVTTDGSPRLLDFGVATILTDGSGAEAPATRAMAMTPEYASPEQLRGERVSTATDVYSLGVLLYELLAGVRPVDTTSRTPEEIAQLVSGVDPDRPSVAAARREGTGHARAIGSDLDAIVLAALRREPDRRYASVAALSDDIGRYLRGDAVTARGDAPSYRAKRFIRRHRAGVAAAAALVITMIAGIAATTWQARRADRERAEAQQQRAIAERRFADVRRLANSFLYDVYDAVVPLPGSTEARRILVTKALEYLDRLASEAAGDAELQDELAAAYDRVGDVQGNSTTPNIGDTAGALTSYQKAEQLRQGLAAANPQSLASRLSLAKSAMKIGDVMVGRGAIQDAVERYREALVPREEGLAAGVPTRADAYQAVVETSGRLCTTLLAVGDAPGALSACERNRAAGDALLAIEPNHSVVLGLRAANGIGYGNVLRMIGKPTEAAAAFADATARLGLLLQANPANAEVRRRIAVTNGFLATVQTELGQRSEAAQSLQSAIEQLTWLSEADPANVRSAPELAYFLSRRASMLVGIGRLGEARDESRRAIALLRRALERPGAGADAFNEYAWALVSYVPDDVRNPRVALDYAGKAVTATGSTNPGYLHTLGWAHHLLGHRAEAIAALERALSQLPEQGPAVGLRRQIASDLQTFQR